MLWRELRQYGSDGGAKEKKAERKRLWRWGLDKGKEEASKGKWALGTMHKIGANELNLCVCVRECILVYVCINLNITKKKSMYV